jgi:maltooligosyltrehalose trehalohydrolase
LVLIAESDSHDPRLVRPVSAGGYGLDAFWADDFHHALHRCLTGEADRYYGDFRGLPDIARALREGYVYQGQFAPSRGCGHGRPPVGLSPANLVFCIQNHDQVGNRAGGERLSQLVTMDKLKMAAALLLLAPEVPLLFQGEEWGALSPFLYFTDHHDAALGHAVTEGRRREFPTAQVVRDPQAEDTFLASKIDWLEADRNGHRELRAWYRRLIALHRSLRHEPCVIDSDDAEGWLTVDRNTVVGFFNFSDRPRAIPGSTTGARLLASREPEGSDQRVPAWSVRVMERDGRRRTDGLPGRQSLPAR